MSREKKKIFTMNVKKKAQHHHASPQPSSSPSSLGFVSIVFGAAGFGDFAVPVVAVREKPAGRVGSSLVDADADLVKPLGRGFLAFALDCAASQPAKSGSPPSSYGTAEGAGVRPGLGVALGLVVASKKASSSFCPAWSSSSSSIAPQASAPQASSWSSSA